MKKITKLFSGRKVLIPIFLVTVLIVAGAGFYLYKQISVNKNKPSPAAASEIKDLTQKVGKLIDLPMSETPTVATVSDITKLKDQPFFAKAQNGDKVLIYQKAKKAILYRPGENKIIEVAVYNPPLPTKTQTVASPSAAATKAKVALFNGTTIVGYTKTVQTDLESKVKTIEVVTRENAAKTDYKKTIVIDLGNNKAAAESIAEAVGGEVGSLPEGETKPEGIDILVILGSK
ncbi:MAG: LytR C-terminal domain-containing protein [Patescibacteria group bacterium]